MAKKYAFLFPGQGAQTQGMIKDVCESFPEAQKVIEEMSKVTGKDIAKLLWETEQTELNRSDNSQLAITAASLAVMAALKTKGIEPSACMGFSLGEFPALYTAARAAGPGKPPVSYASACVPGSGTHSLPAAA